MERECQKRYNIKKLSICFTRVMAVILVAVLLQCVPAAFMGKYGKDFSRKASAQNTEILSDEYSIEIYDGASGEITADLVMPDLVFKPEEDGAWALDMRMETDSRVTVYFNAIIYEWQYGNCWERMDYSDGSGVAYLDDETDLYRAFYPSYYQKGHTYKIRFIPIADEQYDLETYYYTFQKTNFAGCQDGLIWKTYNNWVGYGDNDGNAENIRCIGYIGNETILRVPDQIEGHLIDTIGSAGGFHSISNEYLQVLILGEGVRVVESLAECRNLKDIYVYNRDCCLMNNVLPLFYIEGGGSYYDTVIHGYAGGELEKGCLEKGYSFEPLPEPSSPSPLPSETPIPSNLPGTVTESPIVLQPTPLSSGNDATPKPTEAESSIPPTSIPTMVPGAVTESPAVPQPDPSAPSDSGSEFPQPTSLFSGNNATLQPAPSPSVSPALSVHGTASTSTSGSMGNNVSLPLIPGLKVSTDHYTGISLTWKTVSGCTYQIYRSVSRNTGYKRIKKGIKKSRYRDTMIKSGKSYYYRVRAVKKEGNQEVVQAEAQTKQIKIRALARPVVQIQKKQDGGIRYLWIQLKKYQGKRIEIYYKDSEWSSYRKVKLYNDRIQKKKRTYRIQCMSKRKLYLKVRTYGIKKGKKVYSSFTKEKKIKI